MCEICGKRPAEVIVGESLPDSTLTLHLCGYCAAGRGIRVRLDLSQDSRHFWRRFLTRHFKDAEQSSALACPRCGRTYMNFEKTGFLGCPECYQTFRGDMTRILREFHGSDEHGGKVPFREQRRIHLRRRVRKIRESLQKAIVQERFEDAARLRDEVHDLDDEIRRHREDP